ncbi:hypothetical protein ACSVDA_21520 [Cytobacillus sp. Hm23]
MRLTNSVIIIKEIVLSLPPGIGELTKTLTDENSTAKDVDLAFMAFIPDLGVIKDISRIGKKLKMLSGKIT